MTIIIFCLDPRCTFEQNLIKPIEKILISYFFLITTPNFELQKKSRDMAKMYYYNRFTHLGCNALHIQQTDRPDTALFCYFGLTRPQNRDIRNKISYPFLAHHITFPIIKIKMLLR